MTEIYVAVPYKILQQRIDSSRAVQIQLARQIEQLVTKLDPHLIVDRVLWASYNKSPSQANKCIIYTKYNPIPDYLQAIHNSTQVLRLKNTLQNLNQDLSQLMKTYQRLKRQHNNLLKSIPYLQKDKPNSSISQSLQLKQNTPKNLTTSHQKQKQIIIEQPLSLSLEVNSKIASEKQKSQSLPHQKSILFITLDQLKTTVIQLETQIRNLTKQNLQLKNTIIYYESRLEFVGVYLKKLEQDKEKEKLQLKQNKKQRK